MKNVNREDYKPTFNEYDNYLFTAGEQEARDVQKRLDYTAEQRKSEKPFTGDENTVFAEDVRYSKKDSAGNYLTEQQQEYFKD